MAQLQELLEKEELDIIEEVKEELNEETSGKTKSEKGSNAWIWVAAIVAAVLILK